MSDESEYWKDLLSLIQGIRQDRIISNSEILLSMTPDVEEGVPSPGSCHPALSHAADFVRKFNRNHVRIMGSMGRSSLLIRAPETDVAPTSIAFSTTILTRKKCYGPAPYVGDPRVNEAAYFWSIWVDDYGRSIAGEAELIWRY